MRLTKFEIQCIKKTFLDHFEKGGIYLFGSRIDDSKRGGDIDLYIIPGEKLTIQDSSNKKNKFLIALENKIGEQKIDVVISKNKNRAIEKEALKTGVRF